MKTIEDFHHLYETDLKSLLVDLESQRKRIVQSILYLIAGAVGLIAVFAVIMMSMQRAEPGILFIGVIILITIAAIIGPFLARGYKHNFKTQIISRIAKFIDPSLEYQIDGKIEQSAYMASKIFPHKPDRYQGEDMVTGRIGATEIRFCEVHSQYKTTHTDSKGHSHTEWHTIFKGLFFLADFNKNFSGSTVILPDTAEATFGKFGQWLQSWSFGRDELVKLDDPEFEKLFVVYGTDQIEARYILSPALMQRIVEFKTKIKRPIHLSFVGSMVFVAVSYDRALFEPKIFQSLLDFETLCEYFEDLRLATGIVEDLNLNTRIWSKT
jgi:hypothetical protein